MSWMGSILAFLEGERERPSRAAAAFVRKVSMLLEQQYNVQTYTLRWSFVGSGGQGGRGTGRGHGARESHGKEDVLWIRCKEDIPLLG